MEETLDQVDLDSYFDRPGMEYLPISIKKKIRQFWAEGFKSLEKIFERAGGCRCCGNCCVDMPISISPIEIARIGRHLNRSVKEIFDKYCKWHEDEIYLKTPCSFKREDNKCSIYSARPTFCKFFPIKPMEFHFAIVINPDCPLGQTIFRYWEKYSNSPEYKELAEKDQKDMSPEVREYFKTVGEKSTAGILPPEASKEHVLNLVITHEGLECFANWLEKQNK